MKRRFRMRLSLILAMILAVAGVSGASAAKVMKTAEYSVSGGWNVTLRESEEEKEQRKRLEEAKKKQQEIQAERSKRQKELKELTAKYDNIEAFIQDMDNKQAEMMLAMIEVENTITRLQLELDQTNLELEEATKTANEQYESMQRRFQYLYEHGSISELEILLGSQNLSDILNYDEYTMSIRAYDYRLAKSYAAARQKVADSKEILESQLALLEESRSLYEDEYEYVQQTIAMKQEALADYEEQMNLTEELLEENLEDLTKANADVDKIRKDYEAAVEKERKRQEELRIQREKEEQIRRAKEIERQKQIQREQEAKSGKDYSSVPHTGVGSADQLSLKDVKDPKKMIWPLPGDARIGTGFGYRKAPTKGASTFHKGVDIGANYGAKIVASLAGTVRTASYNASAGNYIEIDHGNGYVTRYLHCSKLLVSKGDTVLQGQVIALVGSTGISTAPHLHFSVVIDGTSVDPLNFVRY